MDRELDPSRHANAEASRAEPPGLAGHAFAFGATCPALALWGEAIGFDVLLLSVTAGDPLAAIRRLEADDHGRGGMVLDDIRPDPVPWTGWELVSIVAAAPPSATIEPRADALRFHLAPGADAGLLGRRFAALMSPLEAARACFAPTVAWARAERGAMPPPAPRFTLVGGGWAPARGLYRWAGASDIDHASRAFAAALVSLASADDALDLIAAAEDLLGRPCPAA